MRRPDGTTFGRYLRERRAAGMGLKGSFKDWRSGAPMPSANPTTSLPGGGTQTVISGQEPVAGATSSLTLNKFLGG